MSHEGIFRISGNHKVVESLKATYDKGDATLNTHQLFLIINLFFKKKIYTFFYNKRRTFNNTQLQVYPREK